MAGEQAEVQEQIRELKEASERYKQESREAAIRQRVAEHKTASARRAIAYLMKSLHHMEDLEAVWGKLAKEAEEEARDVATVDNLPRINKAIMEHAKIVVEHKSHIRKELTAHTVASNSPMGWNLVNHNEAAPMYDENLDMDQEAVRKAERDYMQYHRDVAAAVRGGGARGGSSGGAAARGGSGSTGRSPRGKRSNQGGAPSAGAGGSSAAIPANYTPKKKKPYTGCYVCGSDQHMARNCAGKK